VNLEFGKKTSCPPLLSPSERERRSKKKNNNQKVPFLLLLYILTPRCPNVLHYYASFCFSFLSHFGGWCWQRELFSSEELEAMPPKKKV
jgi:hypothetical protein